MTSRGLLIIGLLLFTVNLFAQPRRASVEAVIRGDTLFRVLPPNAIPAIMQPEYVSGETATEQMRPDEPVLGLVIAGQPVAYSLWQLDAHEIVNDRFGGVPFAVTW